jgi:hypothetical protein
VVSGTGVVQGVCNDSVATIQAALEEPVTMFPCILAGQAKIQMAQTYSVRTSSFLCRCSLTCPACCPHSSVVHHTFF